MRAEQFFEDGVSSLRTALSWLNGTRKIYDYDIKFKNQDY
jgi:hypothetical protein